MMRGRRFWVAVGLLVILAVSATAGKNNRLDETGYQEIEDTLCYSCHVTDPVSLRRFVELVPVPAGAAVGEPFPLSVQVQTAWLADVVGLEASLDLSHAPSLTFAGAPPSTLDRYRAALEDLTSPLTERTATVLADVDRGTTALSIDVSPDNRDPALGPILVLRVFPGQSQVQGRPTFETVAPGPGENATLTLDRTVLADTESGRWTLQVAARPVDGSVLDAGSLADVSFTVEVHQDHDVAGEAVQYRSFQALDGDALSTGQATVFTWDLVAAQAPGADEEVRLRADVTTHYVHGGAEPDWGYTFQEQILPLRASTGGPRIETSGAAPAPVPVAGLSIARISEVVGYVSAFLVVASVYTGGMFGKASRRHLNRAFGQAHRRVAFHNALSYGIVLAAAVHLALFLWPGIEDRYHWTLGLLWGLPAFLAMMGLGVTGALQVPMIRRWGYGNWKWLHFGLAVATMAFALVHVFLDGANTGTVQEAFGWQNPFDPRL